MRDSASSSARAGYNHRGTDGSEKTGGHAQTIGDVTGQGANMRLADGPKGHFICGDAARRCWISRRLR